MTVCLVKTLIINIFLNKQHKTDLINYQCTVSLNPNIQKIKIDVSTSSTFYSRFSGSNDNTSPLNQTH